MATTIRTTRIVEHTGNTDFNHLTIMVRTPRELEVTIRGKDGFDHTTYASLTLNAEDFDAVVDAVARQRRLARGDEGGC